MESACQILCLGKWFTILFIQVSEKNNKSWNNQISSLFPPWEAAIGILGKSNVFFSRFPLLKRLSGCGKISTRPVVLSVILSSECCSRSCAFRNTSGQQLPNEVAAVLRLL